MKLAIRTIITLIAMNLVITKFCLAQETESTELQTFIISGSVGVEGVIMTGLPGNPISDEYGRYSVKVPFGWTGVVAPSKKGFVFEPASITYRDTGYSWLNQNYRPKRVRSAAMTGFAGGRKVLVIPNADINPEELDAITQDLQVMSQILNEKFEQPRKMQGVFTDFGDFFGRDSRDTEATYLQGYGVLFLMEVNFTFSPPAPIQKEQTEEPRISTRFGSVRNRKYFRREPPCRVWKGSWSRDSA